MIIPSIDISAGTTVQLVGGKRRVLDAGDPRGVLERFAVAGEVAVVDIDAARGEGDNTVLIREMCRLTPIRVGGGIRDEATALSWLDAGASKIILGTAATPDLLARLPRERVIAAVDSRHDRVLTHGWRTDTGIDLFDRLAELADLCGGFLITFVEREGRLGGTDLSRAERAVATAAGARVTIAGGINNDDEIRTLDDLGADAQVGMALYTDRITLGSATAALLRSERADGLWPTVVVDEHGAALGLAWSSRESLEEAMATRRGIYSSRTRGRWVKGETSGATQQLVRVDVDCDRDTLRFTVRQENGFCHLGERSCWGGDRGAHRLARRIGAMATAGSAGNTARLLAEPDLLGAKLTEEAEELAGAGAAGEVLHETADLLYFLLVKARSAGVSLEDIEAELDRREMRVTRRPMEAKT